MVVFTCNHCGDSVQKPKVEKHYMTICRRSKFLSCVDCFKDFRDEEYATHTKCVTEEERYAAKGSFPKGIHKKGEVKQENWIDLVKSATENANIRSANQQKVVDIILNSDNVPRKKSKFINFIKNTSNRLNIQDVEAVWDLIEKYKQQQKENENVEKVNEVSQTLTNKSQEEVEEKKVRVKEELDVVENGDSTDGQPRSEFTKFVRSILKAEIVSSPNHQQVIKTMLSLRNIPHKKSKFLRRIQTVMVNVDPEDIESVWSLIEKKQTESTAVVSSIQKEEQNMVIEIHEESLWQKSLKKLLVKQPNKKQVIDATLNLTAIPLKRSKFIKAIKRVIKDVKVEDIDIIWNIIQNEKGNSLLSKGSDNNDSKKKKDQNENDCIKKKKCKVEASEKLQNGTNGNIGHDTTMDVTNGEGGNIIQNENCNSLSSKGSDNNDSKKRKKDQNENDGIKKKKCKVEASEKLQNGTNGNIDHDTTMDVTNGEGEKQIEAFDFKEKIIEIITKRKSISLDSLEKKIFDKYRKSVGEPTEKVIAKYNKKLKKIDGVEIKDNIISLNSE